MNRTQTKQIHVGPVAIGGGAPVAVQSMCNTHTSDARATIEQIARLHDAGCEIIRLAVPDQAAADALPEIVHASPIPVVADIHFDYRLALAAAKAGVHKIRINPGNIGEPDNVRKVAEACRERGIPIRIGVNGGSLEKRLLEKYGHPTPEALVESAQGHIDLLHRYDFDDIALSMKSSTVPLTIAAAPMISRLVESSLREVDKGLIEAALSMGATSMQIIRKVLLPEALPGIIAGITIALVSLVGASAMAGAIGGGGLGDLAIRYGYQRFMPEIMYSVVVILIVFVQAMQSLGDWTVRKVSHR